MDLSKKAAKGFLGLIMADKNAKVPVLSLPTAYIRVAVVSVYESKWFLRSVLSVKSQDAFRRVRAADDPAFQEAVREGGADPRYEANRLL
jgi:hypothetical protein